MSGARILVGDARELLAGLDASSVDAIVTDPPYGIGFMGKEWDNFRPDVVAATLKRDTRSQARRRDGDRALRDPKAGASPSPALAAGRYDFSANASVRFQEWCATWAAECLRVLKPGGHLLAFGGTRTYHRLASAIEDAGFEIRDSMCWLYGSGFPKSLDVSKAIDAAAGAEREVVGSRTCSAKGIRGAEERTTTAAGSYGEARDVDVTLPATGDARRWAGWGTALKPAFEPIVVARKPLGGTVALNVLQHGTGAINVDGCRIGGAPMPPNTGRGALLRHREDEPREPGLVAQPHALGRWPANVVLSHAPGCVEVGTREVASTGHYPAARGPGGLGTAGHSGEGDLAERSTKGETVEAWECEAGCPVAMLDAQTGELEPGGSLTGGASRFFYCAKVSRAEREEGCEGLPARQVDESRDEDAPGANNPRNRGGRSVRNHHPTVKPIELMRWLVRLVTPPDGLVLDPFTGSGSTGCAAVLEGFRFLGCELSPEYAAIAEARIARWAERRYEETAQAGLFGGAP